jgi:hypothetical protein
MSVEYVYVLLFEKLRMGSPVSRIVQDVSVTEPSIVGKSEKRKLLGQIRNKKPLSYRLTGIS